METIKNHHPIDRIILIDVLDLRLHQRLQEHLDHRLLLQRHLLILVVKDHLTIFLRHHPCLSMMTIDQRGKNIFRLLPGCLDQYDDFNDGRDDGLEYDDYDNNFFRPISPQQEK